MRAPTRPWPKLTRRSSWRLSWFLAALLMLLAAGLAAPPGAGVAAAQVPTPTRGELLYTTHCTACHTTQMHWREQRKATDWTSLKEQVRGWQQREMLGWTEADITEVARHLNDSIYRYPRHSGMVGARGAAGPAS